MNKGAIACIAIIAVVFLGFAFLSNTGDDVGDTSQSTIEEPKIQDSMGKVSSSSDLALYYNNDASVYGYFLNDVYQGIAYYDDANIKGTIKMNLSEVKWDKDYSPSFENHINNVSYAKKNFVKDIRNDYKDDKGTISANLEFLDKKGKSVDLDQVYEDSYSDGKRAIKISLKKDILTLKVKYRFETNETIISNDVPYEGALTAKQSDYDQTYKAVLKVNFEGDGYDYTVKSTLKDDKFSIIHT